MPTVRSKWGAVHGDCCSFPSALYDDARIRVESWRDVQEQGIHAAGNLLGEERPFANVPWFWSDQYDLTLQIAGQTSAGSRVVRRDLADGAFMMFHLDSEGRMVAASEIGRGNSIAKDIRLAEILITSRARPDVSALSSPDVRLKSLL
ncbi:hypothetical protein EN837_25595 [bacterium M00.F.Ca.ET.194.01.1.1]|nr:hypothetical protein EN837_25595 [bacterium M00.F.Ca.ET.194.01.1.1]TGS52178.1 hypothetical protein EN822_25260 [bacterium M00.F.Ca.ET.179.01.1.1]TGV43326.1 hypothetical protein EN811_25260 [bacterium M00.F.Ca.ET.168.01.1.1]